MRGRDAADIQRLGVERDQAIIRAMLELSRYRPLTEVESRMWQAADKRERLRLGEFDPKRPWTPAEDALIRQMHPQVPQVEEGWGMIAERLTEEVGAPRSPFAVKKRIFTLGLRTEAGRRRIELRSAEQGSHAVVGAVE